MTDTPHAKYLRLLHAPNVKALEDQIVDTLLRAVRQQHSGKMLPVRLSLVANEFSISPMPHLTQGAHDGQLEYHERSGQFVITLCTPFPGRPLREQPNRARMRFTYAHEVAHRFFFVNERGKWARARDLATSNLPLAEEMRQKITLSRIEEGLCNSIARRVLILDVELDAVDLGDWFGRGKEFIHLLTSTARKFGVSRDCLLVRLQRNRISGRHVAFLVGKSQGTVHKKGVLGLRIATWLGSQDDGTLGMQRLRPGFEWSNFGRTASEFVESRMQNRCESEGSFEIPVEFSREETRSFRGWWSILNTIPSQTETGRILLWGELS
jgi:hypothetical protein